MILSRMRNYAVKKPTLSRSAMGGEVLAWTAHEAPQALCVYPNGDGISAHEWGERRTTLRLAYAPTSTVLRKRWRVIIPVDEGESEVYEVIGCERLAREWKLMLQAVGAEAPAL